MELKREVNLWEVVSVNGISVYVLAGHAGVALSEAINFWNTKPDQVKKVKKVFGLVLMDSEIMRGRHGEAEYAEDIRFHPE